ncbi:hypothetical protein ACLMJK_008118 [Lecanora helva]
MWRVQKHCLELLVYRYYVEEPDLQSQEQSERHEHNLSDQKVSNCLFKGGEGTRDISAQPTFNSVRHQIVEEEEEDYEEMPGDMKSSNVLNLNNSSVPEHDVKLRRYRRLEG